MKKLNIQTVILAGGPQRSPIERAIGMSVLAFPIRPDAGILQIWCEMLSEYDAVRDEVAVVVSEASQMDLLSSLQESSSFRVSMDPRPHRGTGGVLADLFGAGGVASVDCDYLLIIERTACPLTKIDRLMEVLVGGPDIVIGVSQHDRLAGLIAVRPEILQLVPKIGYSDLKEQLVATALSSGKQVEAAVLVDEAVRVEDLKGILHAVERWHDCSKSPPVSSSTKIHGACSLHPSAQIEGATIIDSVCLKGAVVSPGAVVARSIVGAGASIPKDTVVVDSIVSHVGQ